MAFLLVNYYALGAAYRFKRLFLRQIIVQLLTA
jgi:hypothetical protein